MKRLAVTMVAMICAAFSTCLVFAQQAPEKAPELHVYPTKIALGYDLASYYIGPGLYIYVEGLTPQQKEALAKADGKGQIEMTTPEGTITAYSAQTYRSGSGDTHRISSAMPRNHVVAGAYTLVFIFAGQRTSAATVTVTDIPALKQIHATLHLDAAPGFPWCLARTHATLTVQNNTTQMVRFPRFEGMKGVAAFGLIKSGAWKNWNFGMEEPRPPGWFTWDAAETEPSVTLKPGATYEQIISLKPLLDSYLSGYGHKVPAPSGQCEITVYRPLDVLLGDRHDALADFFPVRLELKVTTEFAFGAHVRKYRIPSLNRNHHLIAIIQQTVLQRMPKRRLPGLKISFNSAIGNAHPLTICPHFKASLTGATLPDRGMYWKKRPLVIGRHRFSTEYTVPPLAIRYSDRPA